MTIEVLMLGLPGLLALWLWLAKPISRAARRQLNAEISDLEQRIARYDNELLAPDVTDEAKKRSRMLRDQCRRSLEYLQTRVKVVV